MPSIVTDLHYYPIRGLSPQRLASVQVGPTTGFPLDRSWALAKRHGDYCTAPDQPLPARDFYGLTTDPRLAGVRTSFDPVSEWLEVRVRDHLVLACSLAEPEGIARAEALFAAVLDLDPEDAPLLVRRANDRYTYSYTASVASSLTWACHVVNAASLRDLGERAGVPLDLERFRPNLTVDLGEPWVERSWLGRRFRVGDVEFLVRQPCVRCAATEVSPGTAERDVPVPRLLSQHYGHVEFGFYATIETAGTLTPGLPVELLAEPATRSAAGVPG
ncbi:MOSC domain-containing protein [Modestobacter sp. SYSU DS0511]